MHYKLLPEDDKWRVLTPQGRPVSVEGLTVFTRAESIQLAAYLSKQTPGVFAVMYLGPWRGCMKHVMFKYLVEAGSIVDTWNLENPEYDPTYPVNVYWVRRRRGGDPGVITGNGISTPKKPRALTHQEKRNVKRQKQRKKEAARFKKSPEVLRERADIRRQIARFRLKYSKRQGPVAEAV